MEVELLSGATRRYIKFDCPDCGTHQSRWVNKKAERDAEKNIHKVILYCLFCNAMLTIPEEE